MTTVHDEFLELAAASIDFELSETERAALAAHLADCIPCRRQVMGLEADQRAMAQLPSFTLAPESVDQMRGRIHRSDSPARPLLRLLAIAAMLALLAVSRLHGRGGAPSARPRSRPVGRAADGAHREPAVVARAECEPRAGSPDGGFRRRCRRDRPPRTDPADGRQLEVGEARSAARGRHTAADHRRPGHGR